MNRLNETVRIQMQNDRVYRRGDRVPMCDLCKEAPGIDRHHLITKWSTMANEEMRFRAEHPALSSLLCRDCHAVADSAENFERLFREQFRIYGYATVKAAWDRVKEVAGPIYILDLPGETDG